MKQIRTAIIGTGFMGRVHLEALRRIEGVTVAAVAGRDAERARQLADSFGVPQAVSDYRSVLADPGIDAVHICTANAAHFEMAKNAFLAGKHVLCEKPLATSVSEAEELVRLANDRKLRNCVCHNLRYYPMVQQMRRMREQGTLGRILVVQGTYSQDWLLYDTDWNWRVELEAGGPLRAMADIGSHWFDMAEHITGLRVTSLCADLQTFHATRKRRSERMETFAGKLSSAASRTEDVPVTTDDFGAVIFRMESNARGAMTASQVSAGRKNRLSIEVYGSEASVSWDQEQPDTLWIGHRDEPNQVILKDPALLDEQARRYADLPGGHSEGYDDTFKQVFRRFYRSIAEPGAPAEYPQMADGLRQMLLLDAELRSHLAHAWTDVAA